MAFVLPIPLPASLVEERRVVAKHDFTHAHRTVVFGPDGQGYVHSDFYYNYYRYDQGEGAIGAIVVTRLSRDFTIVGQAWLEELLSELAYAPSETGNQYVYNNAIDPLAVTPAGEVVFSTEQDRTVVYAADLSRRVARFDPLRGEARGFSDVVGVRDGMVLVRGRDQLHTSEATSLAELPTLRPAGSVTAVHGERGIRAYNGRFAALDRDRILVARFRHRARSGARDADEFGYAIVDGTGAVVGRLPLGAVDTPYGKLGMHDDSYVAHAPLAAWLVRSDAALHVFDRDGARALRIGLGEDDRLAPIVPLALIGVGPAGELVLVHRKHHLLVVTDPITSITGIEPALVAAAAVYAFEHARLKKAVPYATNRWFGYEATTPRAASKPAAKQAKPKPVVEEPAAPPTARSPGEAVAFAPHDVDTISVYADSLANTDAALGEYINIHVRLHRAAAGDPASEAIAERAHALWRVHGERWLAQWRGAHPAIGAARFCGLPYSLYVDKIPGDLAAFDRTVAHLPIQEVMISDISAKHLPALSSLAVLRRITRLVLAGRKVKLGKSALAWLAGERFENLEALQLHEVVSTGTELGNVVDTMPRLRELVTLDSQLSADGLAALAEAGMASKLEELVLSRNPIGSSSIAALARFTSLRTLELKDIDLSDEVADRAAPRLGVTSLELEGNDRLGQRGLAWIVEAMPALRVLALPKIPRDAIAALLPIADQLEALVAPWLDRETVDAIIETILPRAGKLERLDLHGGGTAGRAGAIVNGRLRELYLDAVTDADVAALARARSLERLDIHGQLTDTTAALLARTELPELRELWVCSRSLTEVGIAALLAAPWRLSRLLVMNARIDDASQLPATRARPFTLHLPSCKIPKDQLAALQAEWGDRVVAY